MSKKNEYKVPNASKKEENWVDDVLTRQKQDLKQEEEILSIIPNRIKHKFIDEDEE